MSVVFVPERLRENVQINQNIIQQLLDENDQLIRCIVDYQQKGRASDCVQYQQILHRNLVYLATISDSTPSTPSAVIVTFPNTVAEAAVVNSAIKPEVNHPMSTEEKRNDHAQ
ncbi:SS18-like protein 2 [Erpetoichthys calabaricus]|uniref:Ss18, like 2 n=1 Tax=Erpetoichthys calabaricus TaxID=27687 RepID=A0A8C4X7A1_ERPCA|nr:SS18-like protein 2 [Erpetoichthys calabaricus]